MLENSEGGGRGKRFDVFGYISRFFDKIQAFKRGQRFVSNLIAY